MPDLEEFCNLSLPGLLGLLGLLLLQVALDLPRTLDLALADFTAKTEVPSLPLSFRY